MINPHLHGWLCASGAPLMYPTLAQAMLQPSYAPIPLSLGQGFQCHNQPWPVVTITSAQGHKESNSHGLSAGQHLSAGAVVKCQGAALLAVSRSDLCNNIGQLATAADGSVQFVLSPGATGFLTSTVVDKLCRHAGVTPPDFCPCVHDTYISRKKLVQGSKLCGIPLNNHGYPDLAQMGSPDTWHPDCHVVLYCKAYKHGCQCACRVGFYFGDLANSALELCWLSIQYYTTSKERKLRNKSDCPSLQCSHEAHSVFRFHQRPDSQIRSVRQHFANNPRLQPSTHYHESFASAEDSKLATSNRFGQPNLSQLRNDKKWVHQNVWQQPEQQITEQSRSRDLMARVARNEAVHLAGPEHHKHIYGMFHHVELNPYGWICTHEDILKTAADTIKAGGFLTIDITQVIRDVGSLPCRSLIVSAPNIFVKQAAGISNVGCSGLMVMYSAFTDATFLRISRTLLCLATWLREVCKLRAVPLFLGDCARELVMAVMLAFNKCSIEAFVSLVEPLLLEHKPLPAGLTWYAMDTSHSTHANHRHLKTATDIVPSAAPAQVGRALRRLGHQLFRYVRDEHDLTKVYKAIGFVSTILNTPMIAVQPGRQVLALSTSTPPRIYRYLTSSPAATSQSNTHQQSTSQDSEAAKAMHTATHNISPASDLAAVVQDQPVQACKVQTSDAMDRSSVDPSSGDGQLTEPGSVDCTFLRADASEVTAIEDSLQSTSSAQRLADLCEQLGNMEKVKNVQAELDAMEAQCEREHLEEEAPRARGRGEVVCIIEVQHVGPEFAIEVHDYGSAHGIPMLDFHVKPFATSCDVPAPQEGQAMPFPFHSPGMHGYYADTWWDMVVFFGHTNPERQQRQHLASGSLVESKIAHYKLFECHQGDASNVAPTTEMLMLGGNQHPSVTEEALKTGYMVRDWRRFNDSLRLNAGSKAARQLTGLSTGVRAPCLPSLPPAVNENPEAHWHKGGMPPGCFELAKEWGSSFAELHKAGSAVGKGGKYSKQYLLHAHRQHDEESSLFLACKLVCDVFGEKVKTMWSSLNERNVGNWIQTQHRKGGLRGIPGKHQAMILTLWSMAVLKNTHLALDLSEFTKQLQNTKSEAIARIASLIELNVLR